MVVCHLGIIYGISQSYRAERRQNCMQHKLCYDSSQTLHRYLTTIKICRHLCSLETVILVSQLTPDAGADDSPQLLPVDPIYAAEDQSHARARILVCIVALLRSCVSARFCSSCVARCSSFLVVSQQRLIQPLCYVSCTSNNRTGYL